MAAWGACIAFSCVYAELVGYAIHRLLHSDRIRFLSRNHMVHHLLLYGPGKPLRSKDYLSSTEGRFSFAALGAEWLLPSATAIGILVAGGAIFGIAWKFVAASIAIALVWAIVLFGVLHVKMHLASTSLLENRFTRGWFEGARRLHDVHHRVISENGLMESNFGIGFFVFDRVFGTFLSGEGSLRSSETAVAAALSRYSFIQGQSK